MVLSTCTGLLFDIYGYQKGIELAAQMGFDALDLSLWSAIDRPEFSETELEKTCAMLKRIAYENGIYFNQAHAPYPSRSLMNGTKEEQDAYNKAIQPRLLRAIRAAALVGAKQIIVHPVEHPDKSLQKEYNIKLYQELEPAAREYGVKIALENMWGYDFELKKIIPNVCSIGKELGEYYDELNPEHFVVCLDLGHSTLVGQETQDAIYELGSRLHALHVHDNDYINDSHAYPYQGNIDWDAVMKALADVDYQGDFTFEVENMKVYRNEPDVLAESYRFLAAVGRNLIAKFEQYRD